jgi:hypothetical protein
MTAASVFTELILPWRWGRRPAAAYPALQDDLWTIATGHPWHHPLQQAMASSLGSRRPPPPVSANRAGGGAVVMK